MIARDAQATLPRCLETVRPVIDHWTIVDTGSLDDTPQVALEALDGVPGQLHHRPWVNFAHNRTEALELASGTADYLLMVDADHTVTVHGERPDLQADAYMIPVRSGNLTWRLPLLTRAKHPFRYKGAAHAFLSSDVPTSRQPLDWLTVDGGAGATRDKLERDLGLLTRAFADDPTDTRTVFYLARTHDDLDNVDQAIQWYRVRAAMGGWHEEVHYSRYRLGILLGEHVSFADAVPVLYEAWQDAPHRAEALRALGNLAHSVADKTPQPADGLFVHRDAYRQEIAA